MNYYSELEACTPIDLEGGELNEAAILPYTLTPTNIYSAMMDFLDFLGFINQQLHTKQMQRLESMLMPANFSSIVGEFIISRIPRYCAGLVKNRYHNGHPDLIPAGEFLNDAVQHASVGIEVKASRYLSGWQGHNPEDAWLMVFVFDSNRPVDLEPKPFQFLRVMGAQLTRDDWLFSGRSASSRRTITASVTKAGYQKMTANWIYRSG